VVDTLNKEVVILGHFVGEDLDDLQPELGILLGEVRNVVDLELEVVEANQEIISSPEQFQNLIHLGLLSQSGEHQVREGVDLGDDPLLAHLQSDQTRLSSDHFLLSDIGGSVLEGAIIGEVEVNDLFERGVGVELVLLTVDGLGLHKRQTAIGDLEEQSGVAGLGSDVGHDDLALVGSVDHHFLSVHGVVLSLGLVAMGDHDVVLQFAHALLDFLLEHHRVGAQLNEDASFLVTLVLVGSHQVLALEGKIKQTHAELHGI
jgi:hypothetical protein